MKKNVTRLPSHFPCGCEVIYESRNGFRRTARRTVVRDDGLRECPHGIWILVWQKALSVAGVIGAGTIGDSVGSHR